MNEFARVQSLIIILLLVVSIVAVAVRRVRFPYTVALVLVGLIITFVQRPEFAITPELILALFVPPLVFQAAFHLEISDLRDNLIAILTLAVPGVLMSALIVGGVVALGVGLTLPLAIIFGALISATDPVAVTAFFRTLGVSRRLAVAVEGESLFNDGTAIVVFNIALAAAVTGSFNAVTGVIDFVWVSIGGIGIGLALGWVVSRLIAQIDDYFVEITLTTVLCYGAYLVGEQVHVSGVLAVVAAGVVCGNIGPRGMSPTTKVVLFNFWEYIAFLANSLVFLLIGLRINIPHMLTQLLPIGVAVIGVLASRAAVVYGLLWLARRVSRRVHMPTSLAARPLLGRTARRDQPGAGAQPAEEPARPRSAGSDGVRRRPLHFAGPGHHHPVPAEAIAADRTAAAGRGSRAAAGASVCFAGGAAPAGRSAPRRAADTPDLGGAARRVHAHQRTGGL